MTNRNTYMQRLLYTLLALIIGTACGAAKDGGGRMVNLTLKDEPLPSALKKIERQGGKSILFTYEETERYRVTAAIKGKTQAEALGMVLGGKPFSYVERDIYFVVQYVPDKKEEVSVKGRVADSRGHPLAFATVVMLDKGTGRYVTGCVTTADGTFTLPSLPPQPCLLKVSFVGCKTAVVACRRNNYIRLDDDALRLESVTVKGERPLIEYKGGSILANVKGTPLSRFGSAAEMITHLPFVTNSDGSLSVIGRGAVDVYINNRKVRNADDLTTLRADEILSAEIIMNPGARYPGTTGAVIRLKTLKAQGEGLSVSTFGEWNQAIKSSFNEAVKLNYRKGGLDVFAIAHTAHGRSEFSTYRENRLDTQDGWRTVTNGTQNARNAFFDGSAGFNYEPDQRQSLGMRYATYRTIGRRTSYAQSTTEVYAGGEKTEEYETESRITGKNGWNHSLNAYYTGTFGRWGIDFNADYYGNSGYDGDDITTTGDNGAASYNDISSSMYAAKLTLSAEFGKSSVAVGTEETFTDRRDRFMQSGYSADADDHLRQSYYSAFADYAARLGRFSLRAGLRYEHQRTRYYQYGSLVADQSPTYDFLMPSASISYGHGDWGCTLAYRQSKYSPSYVMLASLVMYSNKYFYKGGNPNLAPQEHHRLTLDGGWRWILVNAWFDYVKNMYTTHYRPYDEAGHPGVLLETMATIPDTYTYGAAVSMTPKIGLWQPNLQVIVSWYDSHAEPIGITQHWKRPKTELSLDNSFTFNHGWFANLYGYYSFYTKQSYAVNKAYGYVNLRIEKSLLKDDALKIAVGLQDAFDSKNQPFIIYGDKSYSDSRILDNSRCIYLSVNYTFNATKSKYKGKGAGQEEKKRL